MRKTFYLTRRPAALLLLMVMLITMTACGGKSAGSGDANSYTVWISSGEDPTYYASYNDNPSVRYLNTLQFMGSEGELVDVELVFDNPPQGSAETNFNTMIGTGSYYDVMDLSQGSYSALELYEMGILLDLTPYMEQYMPNYMAWLKRNPDYAKTAATLVNGEPKYLQIYAYHDEIIAWGGWEYRRDWIVKYGVNPSTGTAFTGSYDESTATWTDDVVFPSWYNDSLRESYLKHDPNWDGTSPVFISDWEWMLEIFDRAIKEQGLADGYAMGIYYPGYIETGDLVSAFGGGGSVWYKDGDTVQFGATSEGFRAYLECMATWYANGWLDQRFDQRTGDMFYQVDTKNVYAGNVGLFYGNQSSVFNKLENDAAPATKGIFVRGARQPINDIYGEGTVRYTPGTNEFIPSCLYQTTKEFNSIGITNQLEANGKDIVPLLSCIDYLYSEEGSKLCLMGLTKEQYDTIAQPGDFYEQVGITETGGYFELDTPTTDGRLYQTVEQIGSDDDKRNPGIINRFVGLQSALLYKGETTEDLLLQQEWCQYISTGRFLPSLEGQMSSNDSKTYNKTLNNIRDYCNVEVPKFIKGTSSLESDWGTFVRDLNRYGIDTITSIYQTLLNQFQ